jgi:hypothetical protein
MPLLDSINKMKANIEEAADIMQNMIGKLHAEYDEQLPVIVALDRKETYFGVNPDGTATFVEFDPATGAPRFRTVQPLPAEAPAAENVAPLEIAASDVPTEAPAVPAQ